MQAISMLQMNHWSSADRDLQSTSLGPQGVEVFCSAADTVKSTGGTNNSVKMTMSRKHAFKCDHI